MPLSESIVALCHEDVICGLQFVPSPTTHTPIPYAHFLNYSPLGSWPIPSTMLESVFLVGDVSLPTGKEPMFSV